MQRERDTLAALGTQQPLSLGEFGTIFWSTTYVSGRSPETRPYPAELPDMSTFQWTMHYAIPDYGALSLDLRLLQPLRTDEGFEHAAITIDRLTGTIERRFTRDWNQGAAKTDLSIPPALIDWSEALLTQWGGEELDVHYSCLPEDEGDPLLITIGLADCQELPEVTPSQLLHQLAEGLHQVLAGATPPIGC